MQLPLGWEARKHVTDKCKYFTYHGPNGVSARSIKEAWLRATSAPKLGDLGVPTYVVVSIDEETGEVLKINRDLLDDAISCQFSLFMKQPPHRDDVANIKSLVTVLGARKCVVMKRVTEDSSFVPSLPYGTSITTLHQTEFAAKYGCTGKLPIEGPHGASMDGHIVALEELNVPSV